MRRSRFLFGLAVACLAAGCGKPRESYVLPSHQLEFGELFTTNCAGCHGTDGRNGAAPQLNDALFLALIPDDKLTQLISSGVPGTAMPAFAISAGGDLTDQQIQVIADGMRKQWGKPAEFTAVALPPYSATEPGDAQQGEAVYRTYCAGCHGPEGRGGPKSGSVVDPYYLALISDQGLRTFIVAGWPDRNAPDWRNNVPGHPMSPQEISNVVAWLASHRTKGEANLP